MKKYLSILMLMAMCLSAQAQALSVGATDINLSKDGTYYDGTGVLTYKYYYQEKKLEFYSNTIAGKIVSSVNDLKIVFHGTNVIMAIVETSAALVLNADTHLISDGLVSIRGKLDSGDDETNYNSVMITKSKVDISGGTWKLQGSVFLRAAGNIPELIIKDGADVSVKSNMNNQVGIGTSSSYYGESGLVTVDNSTLTVETTATGNCSNARISLTNCVIAQPLKVVHEGNGPLYDTKGEHLEGWLYIKPGIAYDLWICGVQVNSENIDNIWKLEQNGTSSDRRLIYTPSSKLLELNRATLNSEYVSYPPILNKVKGLRIYYYDNCYIGTSSNSGWVGIKSYADCTIRMGGVKGVLNVKGHSSDYGNAISVLDNSTLNIEKTSLIAEGERYGLYVSGGTINVYNSYLTISGEKQAIYCTGSFDPDNNCAIVKPVNGRKRNNTVYESDGTTIAKYVELVPMSSIITGVGQVGEITEETDEPLSVYTTSGQLVWQGKGSPQLPRGIYVVKQGGKARKALITGK